MPKAPSWKLEAETSGPGEFLGSARRCQHDERFGGRDARFAAPETLYHFVMIAVDALPVLAPVREERGFLLFPRFGNVHVLCRRKSERLAARVDFEQIERKSAVARKPRADRQQARGFVVPVRGDRANSERD